MIEAGGDNYKDALLRYMAANVSVLDADGTIRMTAPDTTPTLGYEDLVALKVRDLIHPEDIPRFEELEVEVLGTPGIEVDCQLRMRHAEGHWEVIECTARNLLDDPIVAGILVTTRNVSRRHRHDRLL